MDEDRRRCRRRGANNLHMNHISTVSPQSNLVVSFTVNVAVGGTLGDDLGNVCLGGDGGGQAADLFPFERVSEDNGGDLSLLPIAESGGDGGGLTLFPGELEMLLLSSPAPPPSVSERE